MINTYDLARADKPTLQKMYSDLIKQRMRMDKFFSMFLEKFERKMDHEKANTPIWSLYKKKAEEYSKLNTLIKSAEYQLKK